MNEEYGIKQKTLPPSLFTYSARASALLAPSYLINQYIISIELYFVQELHDYHQQEEYRHYLKDKPKYYKSRRKDEKGKSSLRETHFFGSKEPLGNHWMVGYPETPYLLQTLLCSSQSTYKRWGSCTRINQAQYFASIH